MQNPFLMKEQYLLSTNSIYSICIRDLEKLDHIQQLEFRQILLINKSLSTSSIYHFTFTGPRRPKLFPIWPVKQKKLPTPGLNHITLLGDYLNA
jgi:hypothetical protein